MLNFNVDRLREKRQRPRCVRGIAIALLSGTLLPGVLLSGGCASPPSVAPLLRVSQQAMLAEVEHLNVDATRDAEQMKQSRASLDAAFDADLQQREQAGGLDAQWVRDAMEVYVPTREALVRHEASLTAERRTRQDNLRTAAEAQQRALELLEQQDKLITDTTHFNVWQLLQLENPVTP